MSTPLTAATTTDFVDRYVAVWHEPDPDRRRAAVEAIWSPDAIHLTETIEARGTDEITARVGRAYDKFVKDGEYTFRSRGDVHAHHDTITFHWEMVDTAGTLAGAGLDVFLLDPDGRARQHYQYPAE